jgi:hypothetical protein
LNKNKIKYKKSFCGIKLGCGAYMEIEHNSQIKKGDIKIEKLTNDLSFIYLETKDSKIYIERSALFAMLKDMERNYETAGMLLGKSREDGNGRVIVLEKYRPNKCDRGGTFTKINDKALKKELEKELEKDAFDSVVFVHSHPLRNKVHPDYIVFGVELNESDRKAMYDLCELATQLGLKHVFSGVVTFNTTLNGDPIFKLEIYDAFDKGKNVYFKLEGEIDKKDALYSLLRKSVIQFQDLDYLLKNALRPKTTYIKNALPQNLEPEQLRGIKEYFSKELNALPPRVRENISIEVDPTRKSLTIEMKEPPPTFYRLYKMHQEAKNKIMEVVKELLYDNMK